MNREDFPILQHDLIYFDNGATTLKPQCMIDAVVDYYSNYTANAHRGDYDNSLKVDLLYEGVRTKVQHLIDAESSNEIVFTKGCTESLNMVVFGFMKNYLQPGDEVLITKAEHASNVLPWLELEKKMGIVVKYIPLSETNEVTMERLEQTVTSRTKVISLAQVTNVIGDLRPVEQIGEFCEKHHILFVVDGAQSVPHMKVSVRGMKADFFTFSAHKMTGPTGVGVLYGKYELLQAMEPLEVGGGMNSFFESDGTFAYHDAPSKFDAGTPNIAGVIGFGAAIDFLQSIGLDKIHGHELELKRYLVQELEKVPGITVYNKEVDGAIVAFNIDGVFSQDTAVYLNHYHICVRAGSHCAKMLKDEIKVKNTCRISFYLYNTKEEIDRLIAVLQNKEELYNTIL